MHDERYHALDNLRALVMWLGILLHVAVQHMAGPSDLPWRDSQTTPWADLLLVWIHNFRVPVFFILAGFFAAMLVARSDVRGMISHRLKRIALPFALFWPLLFVAMSLLINVYIQLMKTGQPGLDLSLLGKGAEIRTPGGNRPFINTLHLWFIYYLLLYCLLALPVSQLLARLGSRFKRNLNAIGDTLIGRWWGFLLLSVPLALVGSCYPFGMVTPDGSFVPNIYEFLHSGLFFLVGWHCYGGRESLFAAWTRYVWRFLSAAIVLFIASLVCFEIAKAGALPEWQGRVLIAYVYNCSTWLWSFFFIGLFLRYASGHNRVMRYLSDSSYWVYLVHMLGTLGFGILLYQAPLSALEKMALNTVLTSLACLVSYHLMVRYSVIGKLLNGRQFPRNNSRHAQAGTVAPDLNKNKG
ncbi:acyltransferase family protein [Shewanella sedimentimangrovi]|uniref:Acyltransferase family protein n=1 Tax=Shewanella sedimentimangrovi TaxID=2814293 RepID=A0ABX7QVZ6_9GAMM|nr:acyltransferase family protein [Shewanella sedimentimangrovi]QSX35673.1 acyltransferase family protein [Shewanella sedimentimangrovi]